MPRGDGMGPDGKGPMTGRGAGPCAGDDAPDSNETRIGRTLGGRFGWRRRAQQRNRRRGWGLTGWMRFGRRGDQSKENQQ